MNKSNDLTTGSITKKLCAFTLPLLISVICQQIYNLADSIIAGKFLGESSFAAISNAYEITLIFMAISVGSNIGCSVIVSQLFGAKRFSELKSAASTTFICTAALSVILSAAGILTLPVLLESINTPNAIFNDCYDYLVIYILGFGFMFLYNIANGTFSAMGDSMTPLIFLVFSSVLNIILDILFVPMGVAGIAWATFIAQALACVFSLIFLFIRLSKIEEKADSFFSFPLLKKIANVAVPSILQQSFISIGNIILQGLINSYGTAVIAGYGAGVKLNNFAINTMTTLGNGISAFTAQNIGACKLDRVKRGFSVGLKIGFSVSLIFALPFFIVPETIVSFFIENPTEEAIKTGCIFLRILSPFYFCISIKLVSDGVLRGSGSMKYFMSATFTDLVLRVVLAFLLASFFDSVGIWMAWPLGWLVGMGMSFCFYKKGKWIRRII